MVFTIKYRLYFFSLLFDYFKKECLILNRDDALFMQLEKNDILTFLIRFFTVIIFVLSIDPTRNMLLQKYLPSKKLFLLNVSHESLISKRKWIPAYQ